MFTTEQIKIIALVATALALWLIWLWGIDVVG
jgi:hypothetical protein